MCGIWFYYKKNTEQSKLDDYGKIYKYFMRIKHRGPDRSRLITENLKSGDMYIGFHRLSIMDLSTKGDQPFIQEYDNHRVYTICNGEIYNYIHLIEKYSLHTTSNSDCEVIPHIYKLRGINGLLEDLCSVDVSGEFACVIVDINTDDDTFVIHSFRDPFGVRPLYVSKTYDSICFSSELKGIIHNTPDNFTVNKINPSTYKTFVFNNHMKNVMISTETEYKYFDIHKIKPTIYDLEIAKKLIRDKFKTVVEQRLIADKPIGFLLSGGVDSSLCVGQSSNFMKTTGNQIKTICVGMEGATDEKYAKLVAEHVKSDHYHITKTETEFINRCENDIVYITESYDITTNRASTGQFEASYEAKKLGCVVLIIGDGSDELFGGYKYFLNAPNTEEYHNEILRLLDDIDDYDVRRADRCVSYNGLEARTPFLDHRFVELVLSIDSKLRMPNNGVEKWLLRESFKNTNLIPNDVLYRPKEAFSDGVSSMKRSWYQIFQEHINEKMTNMKNKKIDSNYTHCKPVSNEALYYRLMFEKYFGTSENVAKVIPYYWLPKWVGDIIEPSARVLKIY